MRVRWNPNGGKHDGSRLRRSAPRLNTCWRGCRDPQGRYTASPGQGRTYSDREDDGLPAVGQIRDCWRSECVPEWFVGDAARCLECREISHAVEMESEWPVTNREK